ncbi:MAG TPA: DNA adenine methylase, partial [Chroococcidiopsis sp.]
MTDYNINGSLLIMSVVKSPLRYPGGKSRAIKLITSLIPQGVTELVSPFFGGGSIELNCASQGIQVYGYDSFKPLVAFWNFLLTDCERLVAEVQKHYPLSREQFYALQKLHLDEETEEQGILFFVLNRASFSGTTLSGGCSEESVRLRFTQSSIDRLASFQVRNLSVKLADFHDSLERHPKAFLYLDPPYMIKSTLYGNRGSTHRGFDHMGLFEKLRHRTGWILSYNNCEQVQDLYKDFKII